MKLFKLKKIFANDESGAVTVDWVVLTASLVLIGGIVVAAVRSGMEDLAGDMATTMSSAAVS